MVYTPFDASREFVVRGRDLLAAGRNYRKGETFDKATVNPRTLRQLFDSRQIGHSDDPLAGMIKSDPLVHVAGSGRKASKPPKPSDGELERADSLAEGKTKAQLLELAEGLDTVRKEMNKKAIALAVIRAGRGVD